MNENICNVFQVFSQLAFNQYDIYLKLSFLIEVTINHFESQNLAQINTVYNLYIQKDLYIKQFQSREPKTQSEVLPTLCTDQYVKKRNLNTAIEETKIGWPW